MKFAAEGFIDLQNDDWAKLSKIPWLVIEYDFFTFQMDTLRSMLLSGTVSAEQILYDKIRAVDFAFAAVCSDLLVSPNNKIICLPVFELFLLNAPTILDTTSFQFIVEKLPIKTRPDALKIIQSTLDERQDILDGFFCYYHTFLSRTFLAPGLISLIHSYARLNETSPPPIIP